jgi:hypothetical protein
MYRGLGPTILGYLPTWAIYFTVYDGIKTIFGEAPGATKNSERLYPAAQVKGYQPAIREHPWSLHILSAMAAGAASSICTNPLWVIKTRFMVQCHVFLHICNNRLNKSVCVRPKLQTMSDIDIPGMRLGQYIGRKVPEHFIVG